MTARLGIDRMWSRVPQRLRHVALPTVVLLLLVFYPSYYTTLTSAIGTNSTAAQLVPTVGTMVVMTVYVVMALGLNVVVGYAGLLDLGYVAFYAAGAYIAGWFATEQFAPKSVHIGAVGVPASLPGLHIDVWVLLIFGAVFAAMFGVVIGLPTLRLRGDYLAIVTLGFGEILPQAVNNGDRLVRVQHHERPQRAHADRPAWASARACTARSPFLPVTYISVLNAVQLLLLDRAGTGRAHPLLLASASATRASAAPGSRFARTRPPRRRWASR